MAASLAAAVLATNSVWSSRALPYLKSNDSKFQVTDEQGGWIISIYNFWDIIGAFINILFIDRIGRKFSLFFGAIPALIFWIMIINAQNYIHLLIARLISAFCQGLTYNTLVIYLAEIAEKEIRGTLVSIMRSIQFLFHFILTAIATFSSYEVLNLSCIAVPILFFMIFPFMPESPYFFLLQGRDEDAMKCLMKLRGVRNSKNLELDIREMKLDIEEKEKFKKSALHELVFKSYNRKCLLIAVCMKLTQTMAGHSAILNYTQNIFSQSGSSLPPKISVLILSGIRLIPIFGSSGIMDRISKRIIFLICGVLTGVGLFTVGLYFFFKFYIKVDVSSITWLPLAALILYEIMYYSGIAVVPYILQGELYGMNVKGAAVAFSMIIGSLFSFTSNVLYNVISSTAGTYMAFWFYALVAIAGSVLTFWLTPESNGKTLEEIQAMQNPGMQRKLELERENFSDCKVSQITALFNSNEIK